MPLFAAGIFDEGRLCCRLKAGGSVWLPHHPFLVQLAKDSGPLLSKYYNNMRAVEDPMRNPLYEATELIEEKLLLCPDKLNNENQLAPILTRTRTPFLVLTSKK